VSFFDELLILGMGLLPGGISCSESRWMIELQFPRLVGSAAMRGRFTNRRGLRPARAIFCPSAQVSDDKTELTVFRRIGKAEASRSDQASFDLARAVAADAYTRFASRRVPAPRTVARLS
jgi:hypothetical protein